MGEKKTRRGDYPHNVTGVKNASKTFRFQKGANRGKWVTKGNKGTLYPKKGND